MRSGSTYSLLVFVIFAATTIEVARGQCPTLSSFTYWSTDTYRASIYEGFYTNNELCEWYLPSGYCYLVDVYVDTEPCCDVFSVDPSDEDASSWRGNVLDSVSFCGSATLKFDSDYSVDSNSHPQYTGYDIVIYRSSEPDASSSDEDSNQDYDSEDLDDEIDVVDGDDSTETVFAVAIVACVGILSCWLISCLVTAVSASGSSRSSPSAPSSSSPPPYTARAQPVRPTTPEAKTPSTNRAASSPSSSPGSRVTSPSPAASALDSWILNAPPTTIIAATTTIDNDGDVAIQFALRSGQLVNIHVLLANRQSITWREMQAIRNSLRLAEPKTPLDHQILLRFVNSFSQGWLVRLNQEDGSGGAISIIIKSADTGHETRSGYIKTSRLEEFTGRSLKLTSISTDGKRYDVQVTRCRGERLVDGWTGTEMSALANVFHLMENGDRISDDRVKAYTAVWMAKYNDVSWKLNGSTTVVRMTPTDVKRSSPVPAQFQQALRELKAGNQARAVQDSQGFPVYPGVKVIRSLTPSGQAQVYEATFENRKVALKVFHQASDLSSYKTEVKALLRANHPNVIKTVEFFEQPSPAILMDFVEGGDLWNVIEKRNGRRFTETESLQLIRGLAEGLAHLHGVGIVHRDMKSLNILVAKDSGGAMRPVIIDLGLGQDGGRQGLKQGKVDLGRGGAGAGAGNGLGGRGLETQALGQETDGPKGSFLWMAPEMYNSARWSEKTDIYALGIIMYEILGACKPYKDFTRSMMEEVARGRLRPKKVAVNQAPSWLVGLMERCWDQDPSVRPTANDIVRALQSNDHGIPDARGMFRQADSDSSGAIDFSEFVALVKDLGYSSVSPSKLGEMFGGIDRDGSGEIEEDEFLSWWSEVDRHGLDFVLGAGKKKKVGANGQAGAIRDVRNFQQAAMGTATLELEALKSL